MTGHPSPPGRGRWWITGALSAAAGLALVILWVLGVFASGDEAARSSGPGTTVAGGSAEADMSGSAREFVGDRELLAPSDLPAADPADGSPAAAVPAPLASGSVAPWSGATSTFTGTVVDHQGQPLAGAEVLCWPNEATAEALGIDWNCFGRDLPAALRTTTDAAGRFELRAPHATFPAGRQALDHSRQYPWLLVEASGFAVRSVQCLGFDAGDFDAGTIAVEPGGSLTGRVVDEQARPIAGARLRARQNRFDPRFVASQEHDWQAYEHIGPAVSDLSGDDGRFELGGFWPGTAALEWVEADGHLPASGRNDLKIAAGTTRDVGDIVLTGGGALSGLVVDEAGMPVAGAEVFVHEPEQFGGRAGATDGDLVVIEQLRRGGSPAAQTGTDGRFTASALEPGNLEVCVDARGFEPTCVQDVTSGLQGLRIDLVRQASLQLTVVGGEPPAPLADAQVKAVRRTGKPFGSEPSLEVHAGSAPGQFVVERIGIVRTDLVVSAPGFAAGGFSAPGARPPGTLELTVTLERESRLSGRVVTMDGQPIAGASVTASAPPMRAITDVRLPETTATSGPDGRYELVGLVAGSRTLVTKASGYVDGRWPIDVPAAGALEGIDLQLERAAALFGTYFDGEGQPLRGEEVRLSALGDGTGEKVSVRSNAQGDYIAAGLKPGSWEVGYREKVPVELRPGQRLRLDLHAPRQARVRGQVLADGRPRAGSFVMAFDKTNEQRFGHLVPRATTKTDADGRYELQLDPGEWILQAGGYDPPCGGTNRVPLTVTWGDEHVVDLVFSGERLSLLVVDADDGQGLAGVDWYLKPRSDSDPPTLAMAFGNPGDMIGFWPKTDAEGRAEQPYVEPGAYTLTCNRNSYVSQTLPDVVIVPGEPLELRIELQTESRLRGSVNLPSGVPVEDYTQVSLAAVDAAHDEPRKVFTKNGAFSFAGVPDGEYRIAVWPPLVATVGEPGAKAPLLEQHVTLKAGESKTLDLLLPP